MKSTQPKSIVELGGRFAYPNLTQETLDTLTTLYEFYSFNLVWDFAIGIDLESYGQNHRIAYIDDNATLVLNRSRWQVIQEPNIKNKVK